MSKGFTGCGKTLMFLLVLFLGVVFRVLRPVFGLDFCFVLGLEGV
jgi:hypothetical protein